MDECLYAISAKLKNFAVIYLVDISQVPDFNKMYELYDPCTVMFFYRNKHMMIDLGTGNNNKSKYPLILAFYCLLKFLWSLTTIAVNWALTDKQEMIDIIECIYRAARKGKGLVISPKDYSTKYRVCQLLCAVSLFLLLFSLVLSSHATGVCGKSAFAVLLLLLYMIWVAYLRLWNKNYS